MIAAPTIVPAQPTSGRRILGRIALATTWAASLAGALTIYAVWFAPSGASVSGLEMSVASQGEALAALRVRVARLPAAADSAALSIANAETKPLQTEINCLNRFISNTQITWGGGLPSGYFLVIGSKDKYVNGGC